MKDSFDNDNEKFSFVSLAALTANVTRYLSADEKSDEKSEGEPATSDGDEEKRRTHREYVEHGLRNIAAFERRAAGIDRIRRKRRE